MNQPRIPAEAAAAVTAAGIPVNRRRWLVVALLFAAMLVNYVDRGNLSIVAVPLMRDFGAGPTAMGTLLSAFFWTYAFLQVPAGYLVDRFGLRWTYAVAFLLWSVASASVAFAGTIQQVLVLRLLLGVGEAVAPAASLAFIRQNFRDDEQGVPTAIYVSGMTLGPAVGSLLGAALIVRYGWRALFVATGLGALVWLVPWLVLAPVSHRPAVRPARGAATPLPWKDLLAMPTFWGITVGAFFYSYYAYFCLTWLPSYLVMERGYSFLKMGAYTAAPYVGTVVVSFASARLADRLIARFGRPMVVRKFFVSAGFLLGSNILLLLLFHSSPAVLLVLMTSLCGIGLASSNYWALTEAISPSRIVGRIIGYQNMIASLAGLCAPILTGFLVERTRSFDKPILFAGGALLVAVAAYLTLLRERDVKSLMERFPEP
jgi:ACS family D-galactonate transporter-like MFS transporter